MKITVPLSAKGQRLDVFLVSHCEGYAAPYNLSRTRIKALISDGCIKMPKRHKVFTSQILQGNEEIYLNIPESIETSYEGENIPLDIEYEDEHMIVLYKPVGMVVHPAPGNPRGTLVNALIYHCGDSLKGISGVKQPGIVHRLDKQTQGLMMAAKTEEAHKKLSDMLRDHVIDRRYLSLVWRPFEEMQGTVNAPIGTSFHNRQKMAIHGKGRDAITHYTVVQQTKQLALIECCLETGRTHQIRLHMAHLGHQVLGDELYGNPPKGLKLEHKTFLKEHFSSQHGHALVSYKLKLTHPITQEKLSFQRPMPKSFEEVLSYFL
jgi:23S rRNA pseudouridine1911/1915/1917 synthase